MSVSIRTRLLATAAAITLLPVLTACIGSGPSGQGPGRDEPMVEEGPANPDVAELPCPDGLPADLVANVPGGLQVTEVDETRFRGPAGFEDILDGLPPSCVLQLTGPLSYTYFYGADEQLVAELANRLEAAGFSEIGGNTAAGGYWTEPGGMVVAMAYSPDGADTLVPGGEDQPPLVGAGSAEPWVCIGFW